MADSSLDTSPASPGGGAKAFLENFATIVGAITVAILAMSLSHEYGYFWTIGRRFQTFLTTTDYLLNSVLWLPLAAYYLYFWIDWTRLKDESRRTLNWKKWTTWVLPVVVVIIIGASTDWITWPLNVMTAINLTIWLALFW